MPITLYLPLRTHFAQCRNVARSANGFIALRSVALREHRHPPQPYLVVYYSIVRSQRAASEGSDFSGGGRRTWTAIDDGEILCAIHWSLLHCRNEVRACPGGRRSQHNAGNLAIYLATCLAVAAADVDFFSGTIQGINVTFFNSFWTCV